MSITDASYAYDLEGGIKAWLRTISAVTDLTGNRIFEGLPRDLKTYPAIAIFRVSGGPDDGDYPADQGHLQIDLWGNIGDKNALKDVTQAVVSTLRSMPCGTLLGSGTRGMGTHSIQVRYLPDPETGRPRYSVDCVVMAQAVVS